MNHAPPRTFARAPRLAAAALTAVVLGALGAGRLTTDAPPVILAQRPAAAPAHAAAAPAQSLAFTADFFEAMGFDARDAVMEPVPEPPAAPAHPAPCSAGSTSGLANRKAAGGDSAAAARIAADAESASTILTTARSTPAGTASAGAAPSRSE